MNEDDRNVGTELLLLLTQQRNLYHQLNVLTEKQSQLAMANSPEMLLKIISGRRKLIAGLRQVNEKLRLIKTSWSTISIQIGVEHKTQARRIAGDAQQILEQIFQITHQRCRSIRLRGAVFFDFLVGIVAIAIGDFTAAVNLRHPIVDRIMGAPHQKDGMLGASLARFVH